MREIIAWRKHDGAEPNHQRYGKQSQTSEKTNSNCVTTNEPSVCGYTDLFAFLYFVRHSLGLMTKDTKRIKNE